MELTSKKSIPTALVNGAFLLILNLVLMSITGYLTLDSEANLNSRLGGLLLSIFIPAFIVSKTQGMSGLERMLKFGFGYLAYIVMALIMVGLPQAFVTGLLPCLVLALGVLFYGRQ